MKNSAQDTALVDTDPIVCSIQYDRLTTAAVEVNVKVVRVTARLHTSNGRQATCSVKW